MTEELYEKFDKHRWEDDEAFKVYMLPNLTELQTGFQKVLEMKHLPSGSNDAQLLIEKYKYFYFSKQAFPVGYNWRSRCFGQIDPGDFEKWKSQSNIPSFSEEASEEIFDDSTDLSRPWFKQYSPRNIPVTMPSIESQDSSGPSFDEIVELIMTGKPVPGIRAIPDKLSDEPPSVSSTIPPRKPWEKHVIDANTLSIHKWKLILASVIGRKVILFKYCIVTFSL